jgi:thiopurine S-methyltransferase
MQWTNQQIGWHESDVHEAIRQYEGTLLFPDMTKTKRILFPLCGKTVDMAYLATKYSDQLQIVGVDGVAQALQTFVKEQVHLKLEKQVDSNRWMNSNLELLQSDFFQMTQDNYASYHHSFDVIFDRASLVAISPSLREDYVQVCRKLLKPKGGKIMLIVIERITGDTTVGPPFSVTHEDVMRLYSNEDWVESVELLEDLGETQRNQVSTEMVSRYYWIECK